MNGFRVRLASLTSDAHYYDFDPVGGLDFWSARFLMSDIKHDPTYLPILALAGDDGYLCICPIGEPLQLFTVKDELGPWVGRFGGWDKGQPVMYCVDPGNNQLRQPGMKVICTKAQVEFGGVKP